MRNLSVLLIALPAALLLTSCKSDKDKGAELYSDYITATCRLYSEPACTENMSETCGFSLEFESQGECAAFLIAFSDPSCPYEDILVENQAQAEACIAAVDEFDCSSQDICTDDGAFLGDTDCEEVEAELSAACPGTTTTGTF